MKLDRATGAWEAAKAQKTQHGAREAASQATERRERACFTENKEAHNATAERTEVCHGGSRDRCEAALRRAGRPERGVLIFLHGYSDSWFSFSRVLPLLSPGYHAFAFTQRGHGDSDKPGCCYMLDDFAADVDAFMDTVGVGEATIVGHSGGSFMAQRVALDYPHRVSRLVLISSSVTLLGNEIVMGLGEEMLALEDPISSEFVREWQEVNIYNPVPDELLDTVVSESLKLPARVWRDYWKGVVLAPDHATRLHEIDVPTLIMWGDQDAVFSREDPEQLAAAISGATLKVYSETGHTVHWEHPEQFVRDLEAFVTASRPTFSG